MESLPSPVNRMFLKYESYLFIVLLLHVQPLKTLGMIPRALIINFWDFQIID